MLYELIASGYGAEQDFNCAERILYGANEVYQLGLTKEALKLAAGFGGGMATGDVCGALTASIMALGRLFVADRAHESTRIKELTRELLGSYREAMGDIDCAPLMNHHATKELKCRNVLLMAAQILDTIVARETGVEEVKVIPG